MESIVPPDGSCHILAMLRRVVPVEARLDRVSRSLGNITASRSLIFMLIPDRADLGLVLEVGGSTCTGTSLELTMLLLSEIVITDRQLDHCILKKNLHKIDLTRAFRKIIHVEKIVIIFKIFLRSKVTTHHHGPSTSTNKEIYYLSHISTLL